MSNASQIEIHELKLDLKNFRAVPQKNESDAIKAMISINPISFFAVMESIIKDGYLLTENIIVLNDGTDNIVKEGNRRIAALKLIHRHYKFLDFGLPTSIIESINKIDEKWKKDNHKVPCHVFTLQEADKVDRVVALTHGKGEKAGRDPWNSVARARHNRDAKEASEHTLDLLEKYLKKGRNITGQQKERWSGEYPLTVLDETLRKAFARLGFASVSDLVKKYPHVTKLAELENILLDIGLGQITFNKLRDHQLDFLSDYGIPKTVVQTAPNNNALNSNNQNNFITTNTPATSTINSSSSTKKTQAISKAVAVNDPKYVARILRKFAPRGANRQKVVTLGNELQKLKIAVNPIAFCFILRSMFEISGKAYSTDNGLSTTKTGGKDKTLVEILRDITSHLTSNNTNTQMTKVLHGAMTELGKPDGLLSVTSMNQLVHSPVFTISTTDLCIVFSNIYPLLEAMN